MYLSSANDLEHEEDDVRGCIDKKIEKTSPNLKFEAWKL
jgi:hypothetical protein